MIKINKRILIAGLVLLLLFTLSTVFATVTLTWHEPSSDGNYYWQNFTLNVSTDINANCSYWINYSHNGTNIVPETNFSNGQNTTEHTTTVDVDSLPHGWNLTIYVKCFNSSNSSDFTTENKWFLRDYDCGDSVDKNWVLGHDLNCSSYAGLVINTSSITLDCNGYWINATSGQPSIIVNNTNTTITNCNVYSTQHGIDVEIGNLTKLTNNNITANLSSVYLNSANLDQINLTLNRLESLTESSVFVASGYSPTSLIMTSNTLLGVETLINVSGGSLINPMIYKNDFSDSVSNFKVYVANPGSGVNLYYNQQGNYWGYSSCPAFRPGVDSNANNIVDYYPYKNAAMTLADQCLGCGVTLDQSYTLQNDMNCTGFNGSAVVTIGVDSIYLNCSGKTIYANQNVTAINLEHVSHASVINCTILSPYIGFLLNYSNDDTLDNNTIQNGIYGVYIYNSSSNHIFNIYMININSPGEDSAGAYLEFSNGNELENITIEQSKFPIDMIDSNNNNLTTIVLNNNQNGLELDNVDGTRVTTLTIYNTTQSTAIFINNTNSMTLNDVIINRSREGIEVHNSNSNTINNTRVYGSGYILALFSSDYNTLNIIRGYDIITNIVDRVIAFDEKSDNNNLSFAYINNSNVTAIYVEASAQNNRVEHSEIYYTLKGVFIDSATGTTLNNVTIMHFSAGSVGVDLENAHNTIIVNSTIADSASPAVRHISSDGTIFYHNKIYNTSGGLGNPQFIGDSAMYLDYNGMGNYWGRNECPGFRQGIDSNRTDIIDRFSYKNPAMALANQCLACGVTLDQSYTLQNDMNCSWFNESIVIIGTNNLVFDCNGNSIIGNSTSIQSVIKATSRTNITVKNCNISNSLWGITLLSTDNSSVLHNTFYNMVPTTTAVLAGAIYLNAGADNNYIFNNTIYNSKRGVVIFSNCSDNIVENNKFYFTTSSGVKIEDNYNKMNIIKTNYFKEGYGILIDNSTAIIFNNTLFNQTTFGIKIDNNPYMVNITENNITYAYRGIEITNTSSPANNKYIYKNRIYNNSYNLYAENLSLSIYLDYNQMGNYWGHSDNTCPGFIAGLDTNALNVIDRYPYNDQAFTDYACDCGDSVTASAILYRDINCGDACINTYGLNITADDVVLNCNNHTLFATTPGSSKGVIISADNAQIINCKIHTFGTGIYSQFSKGHTIVNNTIYNNYADNCSGIHLVYVNDTVITQNNITNNDDGVHLLGCNNISIAENDIYNNQNGLNGSHKNFRDDGNNTNISIVNNYWGHDDCPLFLYWRDTNSDTFYDQAPWNSTHQTVNCTPQYGGVTIYKDIGFTQTIDYNSSNNWYYYYNGSNILLEFEIIPRLFIVYNANISLNGTNELICNMTWANNNRTLWRANCTLEANHSEYTTEPTAVWNVLYREPNYAGPLQPAQFRAVININPINNESVAYDSSLGGATTDWSMIMDFSNVSNLVFERPTYGKINFTEPINLLDQVTLNALRDLGDNLQFGEANISLNAAVDALKELNKSAWLTFNLSKVSGFNTSSMNTSDLINRTKMNGQLCPSTICTNHSYNQSTGIYSFHVSHWTTYVVDVSPPEITLSLSSDDKTITIHATTDETAHCKYSVNTNKNYSAMTNFSSTDSTTHTTTYTASSYATYTIYVKCKDDVNNIGSASDSITLTEPSSSSGGGGGGGSSDTEGYVGTLYEGQQKNYRLKKGNKFSFTYKGERHSITLDDVYYKDGKVKITIASTPKTYILKEGVKYKFDLNENGLYDALIWTDIISSLRAMLYIKGIEEPQQTTQQPTPTQEQEQPTTTPSPSPSPTQPAQPTPEESPTQEEEVTPTPTATPTGPSPTTTGPESKQIGKEGKELRSRKQLITILSIVVVIIVIILVVVLTKPKTKAIKSKGREKPRKQK